MEIAQKNVDLISRIIKSDRKFSNNEDLFEDFFNETCKRSVAILDSIDSEATLEAYIRRIATTSILNVLKDSGRLRRTRNGYMPSQEVPVAEPAVVNDYSQSRVSYSDINIPENPEEIVIQKEILNFVASTVKNINEEFPDKNYLDIFVMRYDKGMTQKEIAANLDISQSEVSKRLFKLMEKVRNVIE